MRLPIGVVKACLIVGGAVDGFVALLALFAQPLLGPLLDVPVKDPALTTIAGGEFLIVAILYFAIFRDIERFRPMLWLVVTDQVFAALLVAIEIARGHVPGTWKTIGPIPLNLALAAVYAIAARQRPTETSAKNA